MRWTTRLFVHFIWLSGIFLTLGLGVLARETLMARGIEVVSVERGAKLLLPYALWADAPFIVLAFMVRTRLRRALRECPEDTRRLFTIAIGSYLGTAVVHGVVQFQGLVYTGPGGFAEMVTMMILMSPLTIPGLVLTCAIGAAFGGLIAAYLHAWRSGPPPNPRP
ncbi:hypothetical protein [Celeribacter neptunius]|uniref:Uncharacterized protein n=1 Tax=Celeribacter neptunius TaxID=588602 RepID=A0A1I3QXK5_9RHOB|nr:hypothetical protein [Celeribacter neptunius]SFJ38021.1 hypothetical protein SAMN04487991_1978 [Celeribacter neptunius]